MLVTMFTDARFLKHLANAKVFLYRIFFFCILFLIDSSAHGIQFFESTDQTMGFNGLEQRGILLAPWKFSRVNIIFTFCLRTNTKRNVSDFSQSLFIEKMLLASQSCLVIHSVSRRYLLNQSTEVTATGAKDVKDPVPV